MFFLVSSGMAIGLLVTLAVILLNHLFPRSKSNRFHD